MDSSSPADSHVNPPGNNPPLDGLSTSDTANETIRQSLDMLNLEYPSGGSPARSDAPNIVFGPPVFDATPFAGRPVVEFGNIPSGDHSAGPTFDLSAAQQGAAGPAFDLSAARQDTPSAPDITGSPVPDCTPVLQDTPSQTVDGTEEVTQEWNVQEQLSKYQEKQAAKLAEHELNLRQYYRKKSKKDQIVSSDIPADPPEEPIQPGRRERGVVRKRSVSSVARSIGVDKSDHSNQPTAFTPRRSPRVSAATKSVPNIEDSSSSKSSSGKRRLPVDKSYVPDAIGEDASADDLDDFEIIPEQTKGRKRQKSDGSPSGLAKKKAVGRKKNIVAKKTVGRKKKSDDKESSDRFLQTVRCSLGEVIEAAKLLKGKHIEKVRLAGFGCVFDWILNGNISRVLMCHLLLKLDPSNMHLDCGSGKVLDVNRDSVHYVFGFPNGDDTAPRPSDSGHVNALRQLKVELGFSPKDHIETKHLRTLLKKLVEDEEDDTKVDLAVKVFFAILFNKLICPGAAPRIGREAPMLVNMDYKKMSTMDFCQVVVDDIKRGAMRYQENIKAGPEGCGVVPVVMYLDSCYSVKHSVMHTLKPRANYLSVKTLKEIYKQDMYRSGGPNLEDYRFGKLSWKGRNQIVYSYKMPVKELLGESSVGHDAFNLPQPDHTSEPLTLTQLGNAFAQPSVGKPNSIPQPASTSGTAPSGSSLRVIDTLLKKVEDISHTIPTTADRMNRISGLFPPGHGPSAEAVEEQKGHELKLLDSLRTAASCLRTSFTEFGLNQDKICREFESEAALIEKQINEHDLPGVNEHVPAADPPHLALFSVNQPKKPR